MNIPEIVQVPTAKVVLNTGQVEGLPANPRQWTAGDVDRLARSLTETPELFAARPILAVEHGGHYVALGGNLRLTAARKNKDRTVPVIVYPADTPLDTLRAIVIKDNGSFGQWDFDALANTWDDLPLADWGVPAWDAQSVIPDDYGTDFSLPDGEKDPFRQVSFQMPEEMAVMLILATKAAQYTPEFQEMSEGMAEENKNGAAAYLIAKHWLDANLDGLSDEDFIESEEQENELREYLRGALAKSGKKAKDVDELLGTNGMSGHYFGTSQWMFPTYGAYIKMREIMPLDRDYFECKKIEMHAKRLQTLREYKKNG